MFVVSFRVTEWHIICVQSQRDNSSILQHTLAIARTHSVNMLRLHSLFFETKPHLLRFCVEHHKKPQEKVYFLGSEWTMMLVVWFKVTSRITQSRGYGSFHHSFESVSNITLFLPKSLDNYNKSVPNTKRAGKIIVFVSIFSHSWPKDNATM